MKRVFPTLLTVALIAACTTFDEKPLDPAVAATQLDARSLSDEGLHRFLSENLARPPSKWPLAQWDVENLTLAAFFFSRDLDVARAQWAIANAGAVIAAERPNPVISVAPSYNADTTIPTPWIIATTIEQPLETGGKRRFRTAEAAHLAEMSRLNIASVAWQVRSQLRRSFVDLYSAQETEVLLKEQLAFELENMKLLESRYELGAISSFELTQARLLADGSRLALLDAERQSSEARVRLADAIGIPVHATNNVAFSFETLPDSPSALPDAETRIRALSNRADILAALSEYAAAQAELQLQIARQYPDINIGPGFEYDQGDNKWSLGISLTLPVLNKNQGAIAEASAKRDEVAARFNALQARVLAEIDVALANYRAALKAKEETESMLADIGIQETRAQAMLASGEISRSDLVSLNLQLSASRIARFSAVIQAQQAAGMLEEALQVPFDLPASAWEIAPTGPGDTRSEP